LFELGNLFLREELWSKHRQERLLAKYLKSTPRIFVEHVASFERWASQGILNPKLDMELPESRPLTNTTRAILGTVKAVGVFLQWCVKRNVLTLADVNQSTIESYKETLFWQYECRVCGKRAHVDDKTSEKCGDSECQAMNACVKIRRLTRGSVTDITMKVRTFFNWAQLHEFVLENPLAHEVSVHNTFTAMNERGEMIEISDSIRRYADDVVERLCRYMVTPDTDAREALVLYFIIVHQLTVTEICKAKLPSLAAQTRGTCDRANDFEFLLLPVRQPTRGQLSRGRENPVLKYPKEAECWLRPLLERYFEKRRNDVGSEYLFVGPHHRTRNNRPVTHRTISRLVHRASQRVLNAMISPRDLRNTAAAIMANKSKRRGAILTKLGYSSERATRFNYLETFLLEPKAFKQRQPPGGGVAERAVRGAPSARAKRAQGGELIK